MQAKACITMGIALRMNGSLQNVMENEPKTPSHVPLPVLPHSGKVEQLRNEMQSEQTVGAKLEAKKPIVDSSILYIPHINKTRPTPELSPEQRKVEEKVILAIRDVYDPEIPVNIYDLGLIYDIEIDAENVVKVRMTLTAPGCPVAGTLPLMVEQKIESVGEVKSAEVELVWDPPWNKEMMAEDARLMLNL